MINRTIDIIAKIGACSPIIADTALINSKVEEWLHHAAESSAVNYFDEVLSREWI